MPPYAPPVAHYTQLECKNFSEKEFLRAIGKDGIHFKRLTDKLGVEYIWWDQDRSVVEIWGSYGSLARGAKEKVGKYMDFIKRTTTTTEEDD